MFVFDGYGCAQFTSKPKAREWELIRGCQQCWDDPRRQRCGDDFVCLVEEVQLLSVSVCVYVFIMQDQQHRKVINSESNDAIGILII